MAKLGGKYETIFVVDSTLTDEATAAIVEKFKTLVEQNATLMTFESKTDFPAELTRIYNITDGIIRAIVVEQPE